MCILLMLALMYTLRVCVLHIHMYYAKVDVCTCRMSVELYYMLYYIQKSKLISLSLLYILYHTILYHTILYYTILYYTVRYYTILYYTIL